MAIQLDRVFGTAIDLGASDIHIRFGLPPMLRIDGELRPLNTEPLDDEGVISAVKQAAGGRDRVEVELNEHKGSDFACEYTHNGKVARFRANAFKEQGHQALVLRRLPTKIISVEEIGFPSRVLDLCLRPRGLFLVTGPTGSGKTTTLASIVSYIANARAQHILTLEEPTEYRFKSGKSIISQREVPHDVLSFSDGLRHGLREDPNTIMVGEMRDIETMECAIRAAETGHLVLATLHTSSAAKTVDRIIDSFPGDKQAEIRAIISTSLLGVLGQQLVMKAEGNGRVAAFEFMCMNSGIAHAIRERNTSKINDQIQTGKALGMRLLDDHLLELVSTGVVKAESAIAKANDPDKLREALRRAGFN